MKQYKAFSYAQILMIMVFSALMTAMTIPVVKPLTTTSSDGTRVYNIQTGSYLDDVDVDDTNYVDSYIVHEGPWWEPIKKEVLENGMCSTDECKKLAEALGDEDFDGYIDEIVLNIEFDPDDDENPKTMEDTNFIDKQTIVLLKSQASGSGEIEGEGDDE